MAHPPLTETLKPKSLRLRLTLTYAFVFLMTGTALLAVNYGLMYNQLSTPPSNDKIVIKDGIPAGSMPAHADELARLDALHTSAIALAIMTLLVVAASWVLAGRMLRPVRTLIATTRRISQDRLHLRIALGGPRNEIKELADTFDEMVARLQAAFASQRRFIGDVSHELRTPLTIVRTSVEVVLSKPETTAAQWRDMADRVLIATGRAERLLDGLLALARSDSGAIAREPHDLAVAAAGALIAADDEAEAARLSVTSDLRPAPVIGDAVLFDRMVRNLVDNAIRHNHDGGWIQVATSYGDDGAVVSVRNSGDTIPAQDVEGLFQPFERLRPDRAANGQSSGLGLAIVRSIVHVHLGTVTAEPIAGGGLQVVVTLPARETPESTPDA